MRKQDTRKKGRYNRLSINLPGYYNCRKAESKKDRIFRYESALLRKLGWYTRKMRSKWDRTSDISTALCKWDVVQACCVSEGDPGTFQLTSPANKTRRWQAAQNHHSCGNVALAYSSQKCASLSLRTPHGSLLCLSVKGWRVSTCFSFFCCAHTFGIHSHRKRLRK